MVESKVTPKFTASNDGVIIFPENDIHRSVKTLQFSLLDDMSNSFVLSSLIFKKLQDIQCLISLRQHSISLTVDIKSSFSNAIYIAGHRQHKYES